MLRLASHQQCNRHPLKQAYGDGSWFFLTSPKLSRWDLPKRPNVGVVDWNAPFIYPENSVWSPRNPPESRNPGRIAGSPGTCRKSLAQLALDRSVIVQRFRC